VILINDRRYLGDFIRLNEEWITRYFKLEAPDHELVRNPGKIIDEGGYIFGLMVDDTVVGVCALFNDGNGVYQLARMAVSPANQGKGYGDKLTHTVLEHLRSIEAVRVYLLSNTKLEAAIGLYRKHGFNLRSLGQHAVYARSDITMEKGLSEE
jgi:putative acetyltransferase